MAPADQLTVARIGLAPVIVVLYVVDFSGHDYWATALFAVAIATDWFDGWVARRSGRASAMGSLLDPVADKVLVLAVLIVLVDRGVVPGWMVAAIAAREFLVSGLRLAALERGVVLGARDLGKLKTWTQSVAAIIGGLAAAGAGADEIAWWALLLALVVTWCQGSTTPDSPHACFAGAPPSRSAWPDRHQAFSASTSRASASSAAATSTARSSASGSGWSSHGMLQA
jgi:CDP-diacylglycerol---glycerol-3-phosphate 3-phosphatidyltransferase